MSAIKDKTAPVLEESGNNENNPYCVYNVPKGAQRMGIWNRTLWELIATGEINHVRIGRRVLLLERHIREFLESHTV